MKNFLLIAVFKVSIMNSLNAMRLDEISKNITLDNTNNTDIDDSGFIDISGLGIKAFGHPSNKSGEALQSWTEDSLVNPEEMGEYFEGDILMPPTILRNGLLSQSSRWPYAIVPYDLEGNFSAEERDLIFEAMDHFHNSTCIRFIPYNGEDDYLGITNEGFGCSSAIGRIGLRQTINLAPACLKSGTIMHELMHTIGFMHEVSREDRDEYINVLEENIKDERLEDFKAYQSNTFGVPYDYGSIMHQSEYAFSKSPNKKTIEAKLNLKGVILGQRYKLSDGDIEKINIMYKCEMYDY